MLQTMLEIFLEFLFFSLCRFIQEIEYELNSNFSLAEMNDILLNIIIRDLAAFSKNIEGLVDVNN